MRDCCISGIPSFTPGYAIQPSSPLIDTAAPGAQPSPRARRLAIVGGQTKDNFNTTCYLRKRSGCEWKKPLTQIPEALNESSICETDDGFLMVGGHINNQSSSHCHQFYTKTISWKRMADMPCSRHCTAAIRFAKKVYVLGGVVRLDSERKFSIADYCHSIDLHSNTWRRHKRMKQGMVYPISVPINSCIYVLFNDDEVANRSIVTGNKLTLQMYDIETRKWSYGASLPYGVGRTWGASAIAINDTMLVAGGVDRICAQYLPATNTWIKMNRMNLQHHYGCLSVHRDTVLLLGGQYHDGMAGKPKMSKAVEEYDLGKDHWKVSDIKLPLGLCLHHSVLLDLP